MQQKQVLILGACAVGAFYLWRQRAAAASASAAAPVGSKPFATVSGGSTSNGTGFGYSNGYGYGLPSALTGSGELANMQTKPMAVPPAPAAVVAAPPPSAPPPPAAASVWGQDSGPTRVEDGILYYRDGSRAFVDVNDPRAIANGGWSIKPGVKV